MITGSVRKLFERDIKRLIDELKLYRDTSHLWMHPADIGNSGGTLALHLVGNLNYFIGNVLGKSEYVRNRETEFTQRNVPIDEVIKSVENTLSMVSSVLNNLKDKTLQETFPVEVQGRRVNTGQFIVHLYGHLSYHLGQINYHRRLTSESSEFN